MVEDNQDSAEVLTLWLEQLGHEVMGASNGPDGFALIMQTRPDVVLCDIGLPGLDGVEVCSRVTRNLPAPPVMVALTGWGMDLDRSRTAAAGFQHHLVKPVDPEDLRQVLQAATECVGRGGLRAGKGA